MSKQYELSAEAPNAAEDMSEMLKSLPIDLEDVGRISVKVEAETPSDLVETLQQSRLDEYESQRDEVSNLPPSERFEEVREDAEFGPVPEDEREGSGGGGGSTRHLNLYHGTRKEGAVMPDTLRAEILNTISDRWLSAAEVFEEADVETTKKTVNSTLSDLFNNYGYVKRRGGQPYEYTMTQDGKSALEAGIRYANR